MDGALAEVAGDFRPGVVGAEGFLVDVLLEDVAEDVGVDFVIFAAGDVVEVPTERAEEFECGVEDVVGPVDRLARLPRGLLDRVFEEEAPVEVADLAEDFLGRCGALAIGFGESLEEQEREKALVETILAELLGGGELLFEVLLISSVYEPLALEEVDEHQPVQYDAGQPRTVVGMRHVLGGVGKGSVQVLVFEIELPGDALDVERLRPRRDPVVDARGGIEEDQVGEVVRADGLGGVARMPAEAGERGLLERRTGVFEVDEAEGLEVVRADEQQVFTKEAGQVRRFPLFRYEATENLAQGHGHPPGGLKDVGIFELNEEDAPRAPFED